MRIPIGIGFALGCMALVAAQHALSKGAGRYYRLPDADLIALEKLGAQAKRAMDAFVLRPRMPDAYDSVCSNCMRNERDASSPRIARAPGSIPSKAEAASASEAPRLRKPRYVSFLRMTFERRAARLRQRMAHRGHRIRQRVGSVSRSEVAQSWESELRR